MGRSTGETSTSREERDLRSKIGYLVGLDATLSVLGFTGVAIGAYGMAILMLAGGTLVLFAIWREIQKLHSLAGTVGGANHEAGLG